MCKNAGISKLLTVFYEPFRGLKKSSHQAPLLTVNVVERCEQLQTVSLVEYFF